jgi:hypothetical protein
MKADRGFALTRCGSGGDSNRRSHPTKSLICRRIGVPLCDRSLMATGRRSSAVAFHKLYALDKRSRCAVPPG